MEERQEATIEYNQGPSTNTAVTTPEQRKIEENRRITSAAQIENMNKEESSNNRKVYCYYCRKDGHYSNQCPIKSNEKQSTVNIVIAEVTDVQQVTTRSGSKPNGKPRRLSGSKPLNGSRKPTNKIWPRYRNKTHNQRSP